MTNPANTGGGGAFIQGKSPLIGIAEINTHANEWREEQVKRKVAINQYLHGYGLEDGVSLDAGEIEELCESIVEHFLTTHSAHLVERLQKLEKKKSKIGFENPDTKMQQIKQRVFAQGFNQALDQAIAIVKGRKEDSGFPHPLGNPEIVYPTNK